MTLLPDRRVAAPQSDETSWVAYPCGVCKGGAAFSWPLPISKTLQTSSGGSVWIFCFVTLLCAITRLCMMNKSKIQTDPQMSTEISGRKQTGRRILLAMTLSARNRLEGKIIELQLGGVMAHVVVKVGSNLIESVITKRSADEMKLKVGDTVSAIIKSTEVMLEKK